MRCATAMCPAAAGATWTGSLRTADFGSVGEDMLLLLADAQTSGGLLVAGEIPGAPVIGEPRPRSGDARHPLAVPAGGAVRPGAIE